MPGFYLMPNGKVAAVALDGGRKSLVTRAKFEECCCPPICQWRSLFYWSCADEAWERVADEWVDRVEESGTVVVIDYCSVYVYGDRGLCDLPEGDRPEPPADYAGDPPDEPEACCVPENCPEDAFDSYIASGSLKFTAPISAAFSGIEVSKAVGFCSWGGTGNAIVTYEHGSYDEVISISFFLVEGIGKHWSFGFTLGGSIGGLRKNFGPLPTGAYTKNPVNILSGVVVLS